MQRARANNPLGVPLGWAAGTAINSVAAIRAEASYAAEAGFDAYWVSQVFGVDPIVALAAAADVVGPLTELGSSVVPLYGRHPLALAAQARTAQSALDGRFTLGIGPSHEMVVEGFFGDSYARPFTRSREYVEAITPLLNGEPTSFTGEELFASGWLTIEAEPVPLLLAAMGPKMLELAGSSCAGTHLGPAMSPQVVAQHIAPQINAAAEAAGRTNAPRVVTLVGVAITADPHKLRESFRAADTLYSNLPAYRAMLDLAGLDSTADVLIAGTTMDDVVEGLAEFVDAGATDLRIGVTSGDDPEIDAVTRGALKDWIASA